MGQEGADLFNKMMEESEGEDLNENSKDSLDMADMLDSLHEEKVKLTQDQKNYIADCRLVSQGKPETQSSALAKEIADLFNRISHIYKDKPISFYNSAAVSSLGMSYEEASQILPAGATALCKFSGQNVPAKDVIRLGFEMETRNYYFFLKREFKALTTALYFVLKFSNCIIHHMKSQGKTSDDDHFGDYFRDLEKSRKYVIYHLIPDSNNALAKK